jgi:glutaredoxin
MQSGSKATIKSVTEEYGLYKLNIDIVSSVVTSYLSKDGKLFFPQALDIDQISNGTSTTPSSASANNAAATPSTTVTAKNSKPTIELFVMSYCPYGTQIEKGILPALAALGSKVDFQLKFVDYSMHGSKELAENLNQYCIRKNEPQKLQAYLSCFLQAGDSASCVASTGLDKTQLDSCVAAADAQYKVTANANNNVNYQGSYPSFPIDQADNVKYNVAGSPTLIINGQQIDSNRDSASLLKTICSAFTTQPQACQTVLASAAPTPGFGTGTTSGGSAAAGCGQ